MVAWQIRKQKRREDFWKYKYGWKLKECTACNGSGYYDARNSPSCSSCNGTGKERYRSNKQPHVIIF